MNAAGYWNKVMTINKNRNAADQINDLDTAQSAPTYRPAHNDESYLRDLVHIASVKAGEPFDEDRPVKPLADQPAHVREQIVDVQVRLCSSGRKDDGGRPVIAARFSFKFPDVLTQLEELGNRVGAFIK